MARVTWYKPVQYSTNIHTNIAILLAIYFDALAVKLYYVTLDIHARAQVAIATCQICCR